MVTRAITTVTRIRAVATPAKMLTNEELRLPGGLSSLLMSGLLFVPPGALLSLSVDWLRVEKAFR